MSEYKSKLLETPQPVRCWAPGEMKTLLLDSLQVGQVYLMTTPCLRFAKITQRTTKVMEVARRDGVVEQVEQPVVLAECMMPIFPVEGFISKPDAAAALESAKSMGRASLTTADPSRMNDAKWEELYGRRSVPTISRKDNVPVILENAYEIQSYIVSETRTARVNSSKVAGYPLHGLLLPDGALPADAFDPSTWGIEFYGMRVVEKRGPGRPRKEEAPV